MENKLKFKDYDFKSKFIEIKGSKIHYIDEGEGEVILLIHGMPSWSYLWRNVIPSLKNSYRCVALDLIGFGLSDSPDIEFRVKDHLKYLTQFVEKLGLQNIRILAHSWGAVLGGLYAQKHESNVKCLAYLEPMLGEWKSWSDFNPTMPPAQELFKKFRSKDGWNLIVEQNVFLEQVFFNASVRQLSQEEKDAYISPFKEISRRISAWRAPQELPIEGSPSDVCQMVNSLADWMKKTSTPQLIFTTTPAAFFSNERLNEFLGGAKAISTHHLGEGRYNHLEDYPEQVADIFKRWLSSNLDRRERQ